MDRSVGGHPARSLLPIMPTNCRNDVRYWHLADQRMPFMVCRPVDRHLDFAPAFDLGGRSALGLIVGNIAGGLFYWTRYSPRKGARWTIAGKSNNRHRWLRA
jgi:hypothetical protein